MEKDYTWRIDDPTGRVMKRRRDFVEETPGGCLVHLVVSPGAKSTEAGGVDEWRGAVRVRIAADARDGSANEELIGFLSRMLSIPPSAIAIVKGAKTHKKTVFVQLSSEDLRARLGLG
jgi:uncharacterized protein (TIGR00251 family)